MKKKMRIHKDYFKFPAAVNGGHRMHIRVSAHSLDARWPRADINATILYARKMRRLDELRARTVDIGSRRILIPIAEGMKRMLEIARKLSPEPQASLKRVIHNILFYLF